MEGFGNNPVMGNGTFSAETRIFNPYKGQYEERMGGAGWLTGSWIQSLHDTGVVGFAILFTLFGFLLRSNYRLFKMLPSTDSNKSLVLGFIGGNLIIIIASQLSSPLWTAFPYVYWGINMGFIAVCKEKIIQRTLSQSPADFGKQ